MAFRWRADNGPLNVVFGSSLPSSTKKTCGSSSATKFVVKVKKANIKNQRNQVPHLTRDTIWESDKTLKQAETSHTREPRGQPFPSR